MTQLIVPGTATPDKVLSGYTFSAGPNYDTAGTMPNNGDYTYEATGPGIYSLPSGYYSSIIIRSQGWFAIQSDIIARQALAAAYDSAANLTYAIDGWGSGNVQSTLNAYSRNGNSWTTLANDTTARQSLAAAYDSSANLTYAIDGQGVGNLATVTAYSKTSNTWTAMATDQPRVNLGAAYDSRANLTYAIDGGNAGYLAAVNAYNKSSNTWTQLASDIWNRGAIAAVYDSAANLTYSIDGYNNTVLNNVTAYSKSSNSWTQLASDTISRQALSGVYDSHANLTYAIDGDINGSGTLTSSVTAYSHSGNTWTSTYSDITIRAYLAAAYDVAANLTYAIDGNHAGSLNTVSAYVN
jgi:hypothetical protein